MVDINIVLFIILYDNMIPGFKGIFLFITGETSLKTAISHPSRSIVKLGQINGKAVPHT